jgi:hypothetical protein
MSEKTKNTLDSISEKLSELPKDVVDAAMGQYTARIEGFAEGFAAGLAHKEKED